MADRPVRPICIVIAAMGGQGGGVLSNWIVDVGEHGGYIAQATSVPGVAQRTGATIYYIELFPKAAAGESGRTPILALMPIAGEVDVVVASELIEAGRALLRGFVSPERTTVIASSHREYTITEKVAIGDGIADRDTVLAAVRKNARHCVTFDMAKLAASTDSVISSVLFGALARAGGLPLEREQYEHTIRRSGIAVDRSLAGFAAGFDHGPDGDTGAQHEVLTPPTAPTPAQPQVKALRERVERTFPAAARPLIVEGVRRLTDYQDVAYADAYLDRLEPLFCLDDGGHDATFRLTTETARHLALWMSYEDAIRVADLKTRAARFRRFREEVRAERDQLVYVVEFMHPRVEEICDILPAPFGRFVMRRIRLRNLVDKIVNHGHQVPTAKLRGFLLLYGIASLRRWRRFSYRYRREMVLVDGWLAKISAAACSNYDLAVEIARCQRLIKGYGDTHAHGMQTFNSIMEALDRIGVGGGAADMVRALSEAALADEHGIALGAALDKLVGGSTKMVSGGG